MCPSTFNCPPSHVVGLWAVFFVKVIAPRTPKKRNRVINPLASIKFGGVLK